MRESVKKLFNKFNNQEIFIVGGGYSIKKLNINYLHDKLTVAINDAYKILPNASVLFWCDTSWAGREYDGVKYHGCDLRFTSRKTTPEKITNIKSTLNSTILLKTGDFGFDPNPNNVMGNNSGAQALNLVVNMKPKKIYLIGYDMRTNPADPAESHFHNDHQLVVRPDTYPKLFIPSIEAMYEQMCKLNIKTKIINCSPLSELKCFEKDTLPGLML